MAHSQVWDNFWQLKALKMMKNAFNFTSKALFILKIFKLLYWPLGHYKNGLIKKIRLISNFMMSQPGWQTVVIHILPNILRSKDNETIKFGQLLEYNTKVSFPEKSNTKCGAEASSRPFSKKLKLSMSLYHKSKVL